MRYMQCFQVVVMCQSKIYGLYSIFLLISPILYVSLYWIPMNSSQFDVLKHEISLMSVLGQKGSNNQRKMLFIIFIFIQFVLMKHSRISHTQSRQQISFKLIISKIHILVKFPCRLFLQYQNQGETHRSRQIQIDQKQRQYVLGEEISFHESRSQDWGSETSQNILIHVKLMSNKGQPITAGTICLNHLPRNNQDFNIKLSRYQDPEAYCQCKIIYSSSKESLQYTVNLQKMMWSEVQNKNWVQKVKCLERKNRQLEVELKNAKRLIQLENIKRQYSFINHKRQQQSSFILEYCSKCQDLTKELQRISLLYQKQKQLIKHYESKSKEVLEEKTQLKMQIKLKQNNLSQKKEEIRKLQKERMNHLVLFMNKQKEIMRYKVGLEDFVKDYCHYIEKKMRDCLHSIGIQRPNINQQINSFLNQETKSLTIQKGEQPLDKSLQEFHKVNSNFLEQFEVFDQEMQNSKEQKLMNDISISKINTKSKEVSLINKNCFIHHQDEQSFSKQNKKFIFKRLRKTLAYFSSFCLSSCNKLKKKINQLLAKSIQNKQKMKILQAQLTNNDHDEIHRYLQELQSRFQDQRLQIQEKDRIIEHLAYIQDAQRFQLIERQKQNQFYEGRIRELQNCVGEVEEKMRALEEEKRELRNQIYQKNYELSMKQEQLMKKLQQTSHKNRHFSNSTIQSPRNIMVSSRKHFPPPTPSNLQSFSSQQLNQTKQKLKALQQQLFLCRQQKENVYNELCLLIYNKSQQNEKLMMELQQKGQVIEQLQVRRRLQFSRTLQEKMKVLNESIQIVQSLDEQFDGQNVYSFQEEQRA